MPKKVTAKVVVETAPQPKTEAPKPVINNIR